MRAAASARLAEMPWVGELRATAARAKAESERRAKEAAASAVAAKEKRGLEIEELRRRGTAPVSELEEIGLKGARASRSSRPKAHTG